MSVHLSGPSLNLPAALREHNAPAELPCCYGSVMGENRCTCWEPVYDLEQQPLGEPCEPTTRVKCCHDCAYLNGSPERSEDADGWDELLAIACDGAREFWCHQGVRRVVAFRHPDGRTLPAGEGDYRPPVGPDDRPLIWRADGTVGERCAGWGAHRGRLDGS